MIYKLQPCQLCQKEISNQARECPHCGHPTIRGMKAAYDSQLIPYGLGVIMFTDLIMRYSTGSGAEWQSNRVIVGLLVLMLWLVSYQLRQHCTNVFGMDDDPYDNPLRRWDGFCARIAAWRLPAIKWPQRQRPARNRRVARNTRQRAR